MLNGSLSSAGKGLMMRWLCCSCSPGPLLGLSLCLCASSSMCSWQILLMSVRFQRGFRDCWRCGPMGRVVKGMQNHTGMKSLLWQSMTNGKTHQNLSSPCKFPLSSKRISRMCGGNPDQDNCVLFVKGKPKITLNPGKTFQNSSQGSVSSVGSPAGESKPQRYFFQFNRESVD